MQSEVIDLLINYILSIVNSQYMAFFQIPYVPELVLTANDMKTMVQSFRGNSMVSFTLNLCSILLLYYYSFLCFLVCYSQV